MRFKTILPLLAMLVALMFCGSAFAGFEMVYEDITVDSGTSTTTHDVTIEKSAIKELYVNVPTLDSNDTCTLNLSLPLTVSGTTEDDVTPNGWSELSIGATDDGNLIKGNSTSLDIPVDNKVRVTIQPLTNQAADRVFRVFFLLEN